MRVRGRVTELVGLVIKARVPGVRVGEVVMIRGRTRGMVRAEVVGFEDDEVMLMPLGELSGIGPDSEVVPTGKPAGDPRGRGAAGARPQRTRRADRRKAAAGRAHRLERGPRLSRSLHPPPHRASAPARRPVHRRAAHRGRGPAHRALRRLGRGQVDPDGADRPQHPGGDERHRAHRRAWPRGSRVHRGRAGRGGTGPQRGGLRHVRSALAGPPARRVRRHRHRRVLPRSRRQRHVHAGLR